MQSLQTWKSFVSHWQTLVKVQQRQLLVVPECEATYQRLLPALMDATPLPIVGVNLTPTQVNADVSCIKSSQAKQMLGLNRGLLLYRAVDEFNVSAFSALCGTLVGGSLALLIVPGDGPWELQADQQSRDFGHQCQSVGFRSWWQRLWQASDAVVYLSAAAQRQAAPLPVLALNRNHDHHLLNERQQQLVDAVASLSADPNQVVWLKGPRGRGKSYAVTQAIEALQQQGKRCVVTASASHNSRLLVASEVAYIAIDALLAKTELEADIVIVEEASSMPLYILAKLLGRFSSLVLVSTIDGYEGTGQGLQLKLPIMLKNLGLQSQVISMQDPLRWRPGDLLEQLIETSFLPRHLPQAAPAIDVTRLEVRILTAADLFKDSQCLQQVYSLLALAHYQTTPQDLRLLLDHPQLTLHVHMDASTRQVFGVVCVMQEGGIEAHLAQQISAGKRRLKGHLLAQILAQQAGVAAMAEANILRVQRIAVHPQLQERGLGSLMLQTLFDWGQQQGVDYLGSSFGAEPRVVKFWLKAGYKPVWAGLRPDAASGLPSLQVLLPVAADQRQLLALQQHWFFYAQLLSRLWPADLRGALRATYLGLPVDLVKALLRQVGHGFGNAYAVHGYVLQWLLGRQRLSAQQQAWLSSYGQQIANHKHYVRLTRALIAQHLVDIEPSLDEGMLGIKVDHPLYS